MKNREQINWRIKIPHISKLKKKVIFLGGMLVIIFVLLNSFLNSHQHEEVSVTSKDDCTLFLENLMIRESGLFTLLGSKPMTLFDISETLSETEEELKEEYARSKAFLEKCKTDPEHFHSDVTSLPDYKKFRERCLKNKVSLRFLDHKKLWESWLNEKGPISNSLYKIISRNDVGIFINVPNTVYILKKYYFDFSSITKSEFDVYKILDSIEDKDSVFWNNVFKNHYLFGLIMGYGQKNSYLFDWAFHNSLALNAISFLRFKELSRLNNYVNIMRKVDVNIEDLDIPYFVSFEINNEEAANYSKEREKIVDFLKEKELIPFITKQLKMAKS